MVRGVVRLLYSSSPAMRYLWGPFTMAGRRYCEVSVDGTLLSSGLAVRPLINLPP